ncbi:MAG: hypothetical protein ACYC7E_01610 [Armatimonadota bacterium]
MKQRYVWYVMLLVVCAVAGGVVCHLLWPDAAALLTYPAFASETPGVNHAIPAFKPSGFEGQIRVLWISVSACLLIAVIMLWRTNHGDHHHWRKSPRHHPYYNHNYHHR